MAVAYRSSSTKVTGSSVSSISVPAPSGHQAGDLLIIQAGVFNNTLNTPSGWALVGSGDSGLWSNLRNYVFYKIAASSSEPNVTLAAGSSDFPEATMHAFQGGIDPVTPIDASGGWSAATNSTSIPAPAITTVTANALVVYLMATATGTGNTSTTPPNSSVKHYGPDTAFDFYFYESDVINAAAGTLAAGNWVISSPGNNGRIFALAIRPSGGAGSTFVPQTIVIS